MRDPREARALLMQVEGNSPRPLLPQIQAPSFDGIRVSAPAPVAIERSDFAEYIGLLQYLHGKRRRRRVGEKIALGDELDVDVIGYFDGKIVPSMCAQHINLPLTSDVLAEGFSEHLVGQEVGSSTAASVLVTVPSEPEPIPCVWAVQLKRASEVTPLDSTDPQFLKAVGAHNQSELVDAVLGQIASTRLVDSWAKGVQEVYSELKKRAKVVIPKELLDYECALQWLHQQGKMLERAGISSDERADCLAQVLDDVKLRGELENRLTVMTILEAAAKEDGLEPSVESAIDAFQELAESLKVKKQELAKVFAQDEAALRTFANQVGFQRLVEHVLSKVELIVPGYGDT